MEPIQPPSTERTHRASPCKCDPYRHNRHAVPVNITNIALPCSWVQYSHTYLYAQYEPVLGTNIAFPCLWYPLSLFHD